MQCKLVFHVNVKITIKNIINSVLFLEKKKMRNVETINSIPIIHLNCEQVDTEIKHFK